MDERWKSRLAAIEQRHPEGSIEHVVVLLPDNGRGPKPGAYDGGHVHVYQADKTEKTRIDETMSAKSINKRIDSIEDKLNPCGELITWICREPGDREAFINGRLHPISGQAYDRFAGNLFIVIQREAAEALPVRVQEAIPEALPEAEPEPVIEDPPPPPPDEPEPVRRSSKQGSDFHAEINRWFKG